MAINDQIPPNAAAVTPSANRFQQASTLYVGVAGDVTVVTEGGQTVTFTCAAGAYILCRVVAVTVAANGGVVRMWG